MPRHPLTAAPVLAALLAAALAGCAKKPPKALPPPPPTAGEASGAGAGADTGGAGAAGAAVPGSQADFVASVVRDRVFFDTDRSDIAGEESAAALRSQAAWLARYPAVRVTVEGHCDERGTRDYNLALGERRANAAKNALVALGVAASRITTVSYGKERPDALGSDPAALAKNRRAVTVTVQ